jgi:hypothetical protein
MPNTAPIQLRGLAAFAIAVAIALAVAACGSSASSSAPADTSSAPADTSSAPTDTSGSTPAAASSAASPAATPQTPAPSAAGTRVAGVCGTLTAAEIQQFAGITVTGMNDISGACAYLSTSGSHSATKDTRYLNGKDGVIIGSIPTPTSSMKCPTRAVQGAATTATVCQLPGPELLTIFKATSGAWAELNIFSSTALSDAQVDGLIAAAFGRL